MYLENEEEKQLTTSLMMPLTPKRWARRVEIRNWKTKK